MASEAFSLAVNLAVDSNRNSDNLANSGMSEVEVATVGIPATETEVAQLGVPASDFGEDDVASEVAPEGSGEGSGEGADEGAEATDTDIDLESDQALPKREGNPNLQVRFKSERGRLLLMLPPDPDKSRNPVDWDELRQQLKQRLSSGERFLQPFTTVHLVTRDRLLDGRQIQDIDDILQEANLRIQRIYTKRRQTAVAAAMSGYSVEQQSTLAHLKDQDGKANALEEPLYLQTTVRSGVEVRHPGTIVILGDVNPGSTIIAEGDIFVWGRLRGVAHAGAAGNVNCRIMALRMEPTQLRIAELVARSPERPPDDYLPEVAYIGSDGIRIAIAAEFAQVYLNAPAT
jgi:septum site-determining protein MinC